MAVVVGDNGRGSLVYRSANGIGISESEKNKADLLDHELIKSFCQLEKDPVFQGLLNQNEKCEVYWKIGKLLNHLLKKANLTAVEKPYFFLNAEFRAPSCFIKKNRSINRQHLVYCFRLGNYPKELAEKLKWSEWSFLFDRSGINQEPRFDDWFSQTMKKFPNEFNRKTVRLFGKILNTILFKIETSDLQDIELNRCYETALAVCRKLLRKKNESPKDIVGKLKNYHTKIADVMAGDLSSSEFALLIN